jgi:hypothetical protein
MLYSLTTRIYFRVLRLRSDKSFGNCQFSVAERRLCVFVSKVHAIGLALPPGVRLVCDLPLAIYFYVYAGLSPAVRVLARPVR